MNILDSNTNVYITLQNEKLVQVKLVTSWEYDAEYDSSLDAEIVQQELADNVIFPVVVKVTASLDDIEASDALCGVLVTHETRNQDILECVETHTMQRTALEALELNLNMLLDKLT